MKKLLTVSEVAEALRVTPGTVYALCARRAIRHARVGNGRGKIVVSEDALEEYVRQQEVQTNGGGEPEPRRPAARPRSTLRHLRLRGGG